MAKIYVCIILMRYCKKNNLQKHDKKNEISRHNKGKDIAAANIEEEKIREAQKRWRNKKYKENKIAVERKEKQERLIKF